MNNVIGHRKGLDDQTGNKKICTVKMMAEPTPSNASMIKRAFCDPASTRKSARCADASRPAMG